MRINRSVMLNCPDASVWVSYLDGAIPLEAPWTDHLAACTTCQTHYEEALELVTLGQQALNGEGADVLGRQNKPGATRWVRYVGGVAAAAAVVGLVWLTPAHRALADALNVFQVQTVSGATVSSAQLTRMMDTLSQGGRVSLKHYGSITPTPAGPARTMAPSALPSAAGLPDLWPAIWNSQSMAHVTAGQRVTFRLNVPHINQLILASGGTHLFPRAVNGVPFTLTVPEEATLHTVQGAVTYGLIELREPSLAVPSGIDLAQVRDALMNLPFLPPALQDSVASIANWRHTLVLPVQSANQNIRLNGHPAVLESGQNGHALGAIWVQHGVLVVVGAHSSVGALSRKAFVSLVSKLFP